MKTIKDLNTEISLLCNEVKKLESSEEKKDLISSKRSRAKINELREIVLYLKTNPNPDFILNEKRRIENRLEELNKLFDSFFVPSTPKLVITELKKSFEKQWNISKLKLQLKFLSYIIS